jgi:hypothetical protein
MLLCSGREDAILKLYPRTPGATGSLLPPIPVLHLIRANISPDFGPGASNGWRCSYYQGIELSIGFNFSPISIPPAGACAQAVRGEDSGVAFATYGCSQQQRLVSVRLICQEASISQIRISPNISISCLFEILMRVHVLLVLP